jgi:hypothetical protein
MRKQIISKIKKVEFNLSEKRILYGLREDLWLPVKVGAV